MKLISKLFKQTKVYKKPVAKHELQLAFTSKGKAYYSFVNEFDIPYMRAMWAMDFIGMLNEKTDAKYHKANYEYIIEMCNKGKLVEVGSVCQFALERMNDITNIDIMYKLASVFYLAEDEITENYNTEFAEAKIKLWQSDPEINSFFLKTPLSGYISCLDGLAMSIVTYTEFQRKAMLQQLKRRLLQLSGDNKNKELISTLKSQVEELEALTMSL